MRVLKAVLVTLSLQAVTDAYILPRGLLSQSQQIRGVTTSLHAVDNGKLTEAEEARARLRAQVQQAEARRKRLQDEIDASNKAEVKGREKVQNAMSERDLARQQLRKVSGGADLFPVAGLTLGALAYGRSVLNQRRKKVEEEELEKLRKKFERKEAQDNTGFLLAVGTAAAISSSTVSINNGAVSVSNPGTSSNSNTRFEKSPSQKVEASKRATELPFLEQKIKKAESEVRANRLAVEAATKKAKEAAAELEAGEKGRLDLVKQLEAAEKKVEVEQKVAAEKVAKAAAADQAAANLAAKAAKELKAKEDEIR